MSAPCTRRIPVATRIAYWATPGGGTDPIEVHGTEPGWHTQTRGWRFHYDADGAVSHMTWAPPVELPIGHVTVRPAGQVLGRCPGTVTVVGAGVRARGGRVGWVGCDTCGWVGRAPADHIQEVLV